MTLKQQLTQISDTGFEKIPKAIARVLLDGIEEIKSSKLKQKGLKEGDIVPNLKLLDNNNNLRSLSEFMHHDFLILNFYRGGWCPYCNLELRSYQNLRQDFISAGADIIAISPEKPEIALDTSIKNSISFPVLSDINATMMKAMGIAFTLNDALKKEYVNFGIDLTTRHNNYNFELPVPAIYVINKDFEIVFRYFEENHMTRLEPKELIEFIKNNRNK